MAFTFLDVEVGDFVLVEQDDLTPLIIESSWFIGCILKCIGSARDPSVWTLFQIVDIDTGLISYHNADCIMAVLQKTNSSLKFD